MEPSLPLATRMLKSSKLKNKVFIIFISMVLCTALLGLLQLKFLKPRYKDFYSFEVKDWKGRTMSLERYRGKATLVVNVASYCQHTEKNYIMLQELQREFGSSHFTVLAFPCNQFGEMEPGLDDEIIYFAKLNYGVTFPIFSKIKILGTEASPAFKFLIDASKKEPKWNFWKYLISPEGKVVKYLKPEEPIENIKQDIAALIREIIIKRGKSFEEVPVRCGSIGKFHHPALVHSCLNMANAELSMIFLDISCHDKLRNRTFFSV